MKKMLNEGSERPTRGAEVIRNHVSSEGIRRTWWRLPNGRIAMTEATVTLTPQQFEERLAAEERIKIVDEKIRARVRREMEYERMMASGAVEFERNRTGKERGQLISKGGSEL